VIVTVAARPGVPGVPDGEVLIQALPEGNVSVPLDAAGRAVHATRFDRSSSGKVGFLVFYPDRPSWFTWGAGGPPFVLPIQYSFAIDPASVALTLLPVSGDVRPLGTATFRARVTALPPSLATPIGRVTFALGPDPVADALCTADVADGIGQCTATVPGNGSRTVYATFDGGDLFRQAAAQGSLDAVVPPDVAAHLGVTPAAASFVTAVGSRSAYSTFTLHNSGNASASLAVTVSAGFELVSHCAATLAPGASCTLDVALPGIAAGERQGALTIGSNAAEAPLAVALSGTVTPATDEAATVDVVEFYHAALDHWFVSVDPAEIAALDGGRISGWTRTGVAFRAFAPAAGGDALPVCRFYGRPERGLDSHFFSVDADECAQVASRFADDWILETTDAFRIAAPDDTGSCASGRRPVFRLFNNRRDANHRYTTDPSVRDAMIAQGYTLEGHGPAFAVMCAAP
jgi:hypothetical protein